ncbi:7tm Odorant receptor [Popillia japonica]
MEDEVVDTGLSFMKIFGEYTHYGSKKLQIFRIFNITTFAIALWFTVANLQHATGVGYMKTIEGISTLFHITIKYLFLIYYKKNIENILDATSKFWKYDNISNKMSQQLKLTFARIKYAQIYLMSAMFFVIIMYWLKPYYNKETTFIYDCWINPDSIILETIVLACQYYATGASIPIVLGCDFVYLTYTVQYAVQLRILNRKFRKINITTSATELDGYVRQHQFLLS